MCIENRGPPFKRKLRRSGMKEAGDLRRVVAPPGIASAHAAPTELECAFDGNEL